MKFELHNSWEYEGEDWWSWSAYLKGNDLDQVSYVDYILHPSFRQPLRRIKSRETGFRMDTEGWGRFELKAIVHLVDGGEKVLSHMIELSRTPKKGTSES